MFCVINPVKKTPNTMIRAALLVLLLAGAASAGTLSGYVRDADDGEPLPHAVVALPDLRLGREPQLLRSHQGDRCAVAILDSSHDSIYLDKYLTILRRSVFCSPAVIHPR